MKKTLRRAARPLDHDRFDYLCTEIAMEKGTLQRFYRIAAQDGMKPDAAIMFLIRWAVTQGTLCPITKASASAASDLETLHRQLTNTLRRLKIEARDFEEDDEGEAWKGGAR